LALEDFCVPRATPLEVHQFPPKAQISVVSILGFVRDSILVVIVVDIHDLLGQDLGHDFSGN